MTAHLDGGATRLSFNVQIPDGSTYRGEVAFPLADGTALIAGPLSYNTDGLTSRHSVEWMNEPAFVEANRRAMATGHPYGDLHIEWRIYTACWAALLARDLDGDFIECGVNTGIFSAAICSYIDFNRYPDKHFYLLDTFAGFPADQLTPDEVAGGTGLPVSHEYFDSYDLVRATFAEYPNVVLVRGRVPDTLPLVPSTRIAYLCIDMNAVVPEREALEYFWDKVVPGGVVLLDDYGFAMHGAQRRSFDDFARARGIHIFSMPTGHGLIIKPHQTNPD